MNRTLTSLDYAILAHDLERDGGFTVALDGTAPITGYAVSLARYERIVPIPRTQRELATQLYRYVVDHGRELRDAGAHLGAWLHEGRVYLDVTHVFADRGAAEAMAAANDQLAIYDLANGVEILS